jgi:hypothetical protein
LHFWQFSKPSFVLVQRITFHFCLFALRQLIEVGGNPFENPDDAMSIKANVLGLRVGIRP